VIDWNCPSWDSVSCANNVKKRECVSNCNTKRNETISCLIQEESKVNQSEGNVSAEHFGLGSKAKAWISVSIIIIAIIVLALIIFIILRKRKKESSGFSDTELRRAVSSANS